MLTVAILTLFIQVVVIMLLGPSPRFKGTILEYSYKFLMNDFSKLSKRIMQRILGRRLMRRCSRAFFCVTRTAHPTVQVG
jgi:hypothetical protein